MCGRFNFTAEQAAEIKEIIREINEKLYGQPVKTGEIYPTDFVPVLLPGAERPEVTAMAWGFPHFKGSGVIINAKSETALEKPLFRDSVLTRRCVVPTTGFYEWSHSGGEKTKYLFRLPGEAVLYLAGCWRSFRGQDGSESRRFVVLTTAANESMREDAGELSLFPEVVGSRSLIHNRMPVVLTREERGEWLSGGDFSRLFRRDHVLLDKWPA